MARGGKKKLNQVGAGNLSHDTTKNELSDDETSVLFFDHKRKIESVRKEISTLTGDLRNLYKKAKAEGFPKKDFDFAFMLEKDRDSQAQNDRRREAQIARWLGHPIGTQADMFDGDETDKRSLRERGFDEGKRAGLAHEVAKPPYGAGTDGYDGYMEGWHAGDAIRANMATEQQEGAALLMRPQGNEPAEADAFDKAAEGGNKEPWPDDAQVAANKAAEKAAEPEPAKS